MRCLICPNWIAVTRRDSLCCHSPSAGSKCGCVQVRFHQEVLRLQPLTSGQDGGEDVRNWSVQSASDVSEADLEAVALPS